MAVRARSHDMHLLGDDSVSLGWGDTAHLVGLLNVIPLCAENGL